MSKKLTINVSDELYEGLHRVSRDDMAIERALRLQLGLVDASSQ